jgi:hypothetical protein
VFDAMEKRFALRVALLLIPACILVGSISWYGGLRSPDEEVTFELCEAIHDRRSLAVESVSRHEGFGLAPGVDGRTYSIFGPLTSIACVPALTVARLVNRTHWYEAVAPRPTFYLGDGYERFISDKRVDRRTEILHAERSLVSLLNVTVSSLSVVLLFVLCLQLGATIGASLVTATLFLVATPAWGYAGTLFSEPLATMFLLAGLTLLLQRTTRASLAAGVTLGLSVAAHISMAITVPFIALWFVRDRWRNRRQIFFLCLGLCAVVMVLGAYNFYRFGDFLETGRSVDEALATRFRYGSFVSPWKGLYGLTLSPGKGLLVYCPIVIFALALAWRAWPQSYRFLAGCLLTSFVVRVLFIATRSDWHGGFCVGPRYLMPIVPLLLVPVSLWLTQRLPNLARWQKALFAAGIGACVAQQLIFVLFEPFSYYQGVRINALLSGVDVFAHYRIYYEWKYALFPNLLAGERGTWLLSTLPGGNGVLYASALCIIAIAAIGLRRLTSRDVRMRWTCSTPH